MIEHQMHDEAWVVQQREIEQGDETAKQACVALHVWIDRLPTGLVEKRRLQYSPVT